MEIDNSELLLSSLLQWFGHGDEYKLVIFKDGQWEIMDKDKTVNNNICAINGAKLDVLQMWFENHSLLKFMEAYAEGYFNAIDDLNARHIEEFWNLWKEECKMDKKVNIHNKKGLIKLILRFNYPSAKYELVDISNNGIWKWEEYKELNDSVYKINIGSILKLANKYSKKDGINLEKSIKLAFKDIEQEVQEFYLEGEYSYIKDEIKRNERISKVVNKLVEEDEFFKGLDKKKIDHFLQFIKDNIPSYQLDVLSDENFFIRIKKALAIELICGLLNDLSEEQIKTFKSTVENKKEE